MTAQTLNALDARPEARAWWREPMMWLVVGGPVAVVVAGFVTLALAMQTPDPVIADDYYRRGLEINQELARRRQAAQAEQAVKAEQAAQGEALAPALQARNHAATPHKPPTTTTH